MSDLVLFYDEFCCSLWLFIGHSLNEAKKNQPKIDTSNKIVTCHSFSKDDFDALFDNLDEVEL